MSAPPLSLIDMVLLISGGFVVIGEVLFPALIIPITDLLFNNLSSPLEDDHVSHVSTMLFENIYESTTNKNIISEEQENIKKK